MATRKQRDDEVHYNVADVRRELGGISGELIRKLLRAGAFPRAYKLGADWFIPAGDVTADLRYRYGPGGPNRRPGQPRRDPRTHGAPVATRRAPPPSAPSAGAQTS